MILSLRAALLGATTIMALPVPMSVAEKLDDQLFTLIKIDELEHRFQDGNDLVTWDGQARIGTDEYKVTLKAEGEYDRSARRVGEAELQLRYQWMISDFFDAHVGFRHDIKPDPSRSYAVIGVNGLAPQWFEADASLFVSHKGDPSGRIEFEYDVLFTQRLVLEPSLELNLAFTDDRDTGIGAGLSDINIGLRLRYEFFREFAPYIGVNWERKIGKTAKFANAEGEDSNVLSYLAGIRLFF